MLPGVRLGIDVGTARVGVAQSDPAGLLAVPVETITVDSAAAESNVYARIIELCHQLESVTVYVGWPRSLSGASTASTRGAEAFARHVASLVDIPIRLVDERLSTVAAHAQLRETGKKTKQMRGIVDQVAAVNILQTALDYERNHDQLAGTALTSLPD